MKKVLYTKEGKKFSIKDITKDFHSQYGFYKAADLKKKGTITSNTGKEAAILDASFIDLYQKIRRSAQIIPMKDIGSILVKTGIGKESKVVDAGAGSGALALMLANFVKEVTTYEIREDFYELVKKNIENLGIKNLKIKNKDVKEISEKNVDLITLDIPDPWTAIEPVKKALKIGGFLVSYSPTTPQVTDFVNEINHHKEFIYLETTEILERQWEFSERKVRPKSQQIGHSGFLTFVRRIS
ncbi:methyltransferase domain-containing protein [Candidatus Woesearchaeota archaeon]|nr:methyltransferase domain-containing protein [Candidatus Woesearchaeota archaeon]